MAKTDKTTDLAAENTAAPAKENETQNTVKKEKVKALRVRAFNDRFRRAGITFDKEEQIVKLSDISAAQADMIRNEPLLAVSETEIEAQSTVE